MLGDRRTQESLARLMRVIERLGPYYDPDLP
jgi:hypothetical protein